MIAFLVALLLFVAPTQSVWCVQNPGYTGFAPSLLGEVVGDVVESADMSIEGVPFDWYSIYELAPDARFSAEIAVQRTDDAFDYLYLIEAASTPEVLYVYVLDHWQPGSDGQPHGCGAYIVSKEQMSWHFR